MQKKVQPRILPGFMELLPQDQIVFNQMYDTIRRVYERFGFLPLDTPVIEFSDVLLAKAGGETEKQIYRFQKGDTDLSLRFDLTVPLARYVAQRYNDLVFPFKRYQMSKVFRGERPQKGRFREFYQCDIDIIGNEKLDLYYDAEMPAVIYHVFKELNIGDFTIRLNNRKILNGFFSQLGLSERAGDILRVIDKLEKIGAQAVSEELLDLGVSESGIEQILNFVMLNGSNTEILTQLQSLSDDVVFAEGVAELQTVITALGQFGIPEQNYKIDLTIARGLDYYTGTVYETMLNDYPKLGSICSGGRYDNLTGYYTDQHLPGIGISIGLTRLYFQLREAGILPSGGKKSLTQVLVVALDREQVPYALRVAGVLRDANIVTDIYFSDKGMKQKMKYADRSGIPYAAIIGTDEAAAGTVMLKNMQTGGQQAIDIDSIAQAVR